MSGPVTTDDAPPVGGHGTVEPATVEVLASRTSRVGSLEVRRALPRRAHRTVGAWCFADHMGPVTIPPEQAVDIGPHPHIGLQTVTWLLAGELLHRDSLGSEQVIRPGQLNLMTAGRGVAHAEESPAADPRGERRLHGVQLWVAQPDATRHGDPAFEHHAELPQADLPAATATVLVGSFAGAASPARRDTDHVGVDLAVRAGTTRAPLRPHHEHALVVLSGAVAVDGTVVGPGRLAYLGTGRDELALTAREPGRVLLLGGEPFTEDILMWWNFVARTPDEVEQAAGAWQAGDDRFGPTGSRLARIAAPARPPWPLGRPPG